MTHKTLAALPLLAGLLALSGCSSTLNGAKQDAANDTQAVQQAGGQVAQDAQKTAADAKQTVTDAGAATARAARNATEAAVLTPSIKAAILADVVLAGSRRNIHTQVSGNVVHLVGHVASDEMKRRAGEDAQTEITNRHATATLSNDLTVTGS